MADLHHSLPIGTYGCRSGFWYDNKTAICRHKEYDFLNWGDVASILFIVLSFLCILVNLTVLGVFIRNRNTPVVKTANRELSFLLLVLLLVAFLVPLIHIGMPTVPQCISHIVIQGPLLTGILSILLVKTHRVLVIFKARQPRMSSQQCFLGQRLQIVTVLVLVFVQILLVTVYVSAKTPEVSLIDLEDISTKYVYVECSYGGTIFAVTYVYVLTIGLLGFVFAIRSRHLPSNFRESRHIAASLATTLIVWGSLLPVAPITHGRLNTILTNLCLTISPIGQLTFLFFPKCYIILFCPQRNTVQELRRMTLAHMQRRSEHSLNKQALPRLNTIDETDAQHAHVERGSTKGTNTKLTERSRHDSNVWSVYFIADEYTAANDAVEATRDILNITFQAQATVSGVNESLGIDNLAFVQYIPVSKQSSSSNIVNRQCSLPCSASAEEAANLKKESKLEHSQINKMSSEPVLNTRLTSSESFCFPTTNAMCISLVGTLTASATFSSPQMRVNTTWNTLKSADAQNTKKDELQAQCNNGNLYTQDHILADQND